jgi:peptidoglycan/LPS O-acetylase OafA/YrhL
MVYTSERLFGRTGATREFFGRRLLRIVPLYWALTTLVVVGWYGLKLPDHVTWGNVIGSYLFIPTERPNGTTNPVLGVGWTLNYEMFFYCLFAATIVLRRNAAVIALSIALFAIVAISFQQPPMSVWSSSLVCEFAFGMWIAVAYREGWRINPSLSIALIAAGLALSVYAYMGEFAVVSRVFGWGIGAALVVASVTLCRARFSTPSWLLPLVALGDASYALYLVHSFVPVAMIALHAPRFIDPAQHAYIYCGISVAASIGAAFALDVLDKAARSKIRALLKTRTAVPALD